MPDLILSLDLGKSSDHSALVALKRSLVVGPGGLPGRDQAGNHLYRFDAVHLERWPLRVSYPSVVAGVRSLLARPEVTRLRPHLAIDATGVGSAMVDMFMEEAIEAECYPLTTTGGDSVGRGPWLDGLHWHLKVPKSELVGSVVAGLESGRLLIVPGLPLAKALQAELLNFRTRLTRAANQTYSAAGGTHDDLVMALAMGCWLGSSVFAPFRPAEVGDRDRHLLSAESAAERAALARGREAEARAALNRRTAGLAGVFSWGRSGA